MYRDSGLIPLLFAIVMEVIAGSFGLVCLGTCYMRLICW